MFHLQRAEKSLQGFLIMRPWKVVAIDVEILYKWQYWFESLLLLTIWSESLARDAPSLLAAVRIKTRPSAYWLLLFLSSLSFFSVAAYRSSISTATQRNRVQDVIEIRETNWQPIDHTFLFILKCFSSPIKWQWIVGHLCPNAWVICYIYDLVFSVDQSRMI